MADLKTKQNDESVEKFLNSIEDAAKRSDCFEISQMMAQVSKHPAKMWGSSIVGFDSYHYKYESGREGEMCLIGFSPRKQSITLYIMGGAGDEEELLSKLGKYKVTGGCLYINRLNEVDAKILRKLIQSSYSFLRKKRR